MPKVDDVDPKSMPPSRESRPQIESVISQLPNEFGIFDANDRLILASRGLLERCNLQGISRSSFTLNKVLLRIASKIASIDGEEIAEWNMPIRLILNRLKASGENAVKIGFQDDSWRLIAVHSTSSGAHVIQCTDITHKIEANASVFSTRRSNDIIRQVLEACPFALVMARLSDRKILYESPANNKMFSEDEKNKSDRVGVYDVDPCRREEYLKRLCKNGFVNDFEMHFRRLDGTEFVAALSARLIEFEGEQVIVSGAVDLTERRAVEAELASQREVLHQSEKLSAMGELLAGVSHELNNPLSVLVGHALMLGEQAPDDKVAARAAKIGEAANRCARIVKSFLTMAREESTEKAPIDLAEVIDRALEVTAYAIRTSGIDVSLRMATNLPAVTAHADQMRQVLTNLIINARDALQEVDGPRRVRVTASYSDKTEQVVIRIKDNGPGVPAEIRSRIFEPLYTTKGVVAGTGMGLALCHRIIEGHGGTIVAEGAPGQGAVFAIRLPRAPRAKVSAVSKRKVVGTISKYHVLVVDDEQDVREVISDVLEHDGHTVDVAASAELALQKIRHRSYDIVLCDIRMPGMDGPSFYRLLSEMKPERIEGLAFITGDILSPPVQEFLDASERPYLEKPVTPRDIRELLDLLMRRKAN